MENSLLSVVTVTYNHEPYITKTIEGVLSQQINFPMEFIIAEDCSKDGTRAICNRYALQYPSLIKFITSEANVGAIENERRAMLVATGKYIAFCEGDDYWTDPLKLQKQVDFLEANPDYSVCFHRYRNYDVEREIFREDYCGWLFHDRKVEGVEITIGQFFQTWITQPLTMVYRRESFDLSISSRYKNYRDMHQIYHLLLAGKGYIFAFDGGVRNMHGGGMASMIDKEKSLDVIFDISRELYQINKNIYTKKYYESALQWCINDYRSPSKRFILSIRLFFLDKKLKRLFENFFKLMHKNQEK